MGEETEPTRSPWLPLLDWLRQPTSIMGFAVLLGTGVELAVGHMEFHTAVGSFAAGLTLILAPEKSPKTKD